MGVKDIQGWSMQLSSSLFRTAGVLQTAVFVGLYNMEVLGIQWNFSYTACIVGRVLTCDFMFKNAYVYCRQELSHNYRQSETDIREESRIYDP